MKNFLIFIKLSEIDIGGVSFTQKYFSKTFEKNKLKTHDATYLSRESSLIGVIMKLIKTNYFCRFMKFNTEILSRINLH